MTDSAARILVVDDEEASRYALVRTLQRAGHSIMEASTGGQALQVANSAQPDLIVLDVCLPDILGFEVAERLKASPDTRSIAILQISASFTAADAQAQGLQRGADAYLTHPIDPQVLCATVQALLRTRRAERLEAEARERAEAAQREYQFLADMVPQMVWASRPDGTVDYFNQRWCQFNGVRRDQTSTFDWRESLHPEDREPFRRNWERSLATGEPLEVECRRWSPPAGAFRWLLIRAMPMRDAGGTILRWFGTSTDIEAQKQALLERERLLRAARDAADERERLVVQLRDEARRKNEFLAVLSHELRNPLMPIRNSVYILERAAPDGEQAKRAREVIDRQTHHMTRLVDDLLDVTRISRGKIRIQRERLELNGLVRRAAEDHREQFRRAGLDLEVRTWDETLAVDGDSTRLAQVIGNLLQNAVKFTPSGGKVTLSVHLEAPSVALIRVRDTGAGIAKETLDRVFEPFVQSDTTLDRSRGGLGLGLALAKGIIELHGGSIAASSEGEGLGSEFAVRLPLVKHTGPKLALVPGEVAPNNCKRILVIEDNQDAALSLKEALELSGHIVDVAFDGPSGIDKARASMPDVVLCDIGLPLMDGYEVARQLRRDPRLQPTLLVALSGYALPEDIDRCRESGFDHHLAKPPVMAEVERLLATNRLQASA